MHQGSGAGPALSHVVAGHQVARVGLLVDVDAPPGSVSGDLEPQVGACLAEVVAVVGLQQEAHCLLGAILAADHKQVVHVDQDVHCLRLPVADKQAPICSNWGEAHSPEILGQAIIPHLGGLLEAIEGAVEKAGLVGRNIAETLGRDDPDLLVQVAIEEGRLHIQLPDLQVLGCSIAQHGSDSVGTGDWGVGLKVVDSRDLPESLGDEAGLVARDAAVRGILDGKDPTAGNLLGSRGQRKNAPGLLLHQGLELGVHSLLPLHPVGAPLGLCEGAGNCGAGALAGLEGLLRGSCSSLNASRAPQFRDGLHDWLYDGLHLLLLHGCGEDISPSCHGDASSLGAGAARAVPGLGPRDSRERGIEAEEVVPLLAPITKQHSAGDGGRCGVAHLAGDSLILTLALILNVQSHVVTDLNLAIVEVVGVEDDVPAHLDLAGGRHPEAVGVALITDEVACLALRLQLLPWPADVGHAAAAEGVQAAQVGGEAGQALARRDVHALHWQIVSQPVDRLDGLSPEVRGQVGIRERSPHSVQEGAVEPLSPSVGGGRVGRRKLGHDAPLLVVAAQSCIGELSAAISPHAAHLVVSLGLEDSNHGLQIFGDIGFVAEQAHLRSP